ncbi:MAG: zinc ribbon domain-containing protein [Methanobacteriaceae archaeon]|jgi:hypothetical protein|nr:zinc ribbon domain-containing protein [Methanobacteriaceae archaeon]
MVFCNSCGKPMVKEDYGSNEDGTSNEDYCMDCFKEGKFIEPDLSLDDMIIKCSKKILDKNPRLQEEQATGIVMGFIPGLKRWNKEV